MRTHGASIKPINLGDIGACNIDDKGEIIFIFADRSKGKSGVSFSETESKIIVESVGDYIGKILFPDEGGE